MNEFDAMVSAIQAEPESDARILVLADWLQERGHEDYARRLRQHVANRGDRDFIVQELRRDSWLGGDRVLRVTTTSASDGPVTVAVQRLPVDEKPITVRVITREPEPK